MRGVLVFGDSIVWGRGENPSYSWVGRLKNDFEKQNFYNTVYNLGIPGETSNSLQQRFLVELKSRVVKKRTEDDFLIIIAVGMNDSRFLDENNCEVEIEEFEKYIRSLISISKQYTNNIAVLEITPVDEKKTTPYESHHYTNERICLFNNIICKAAKEEDVHLISVFEEFKAKNLNELLVDGIHPNTKGYDILYSIIKIGLNKLHFFQEKNLYNNVVTLE